MGRSECARQLRRAQRRGTEAHVVSGTQHSPSFQVSTSICGLRPSVAMPYALRMISWRMCGSENIGFQNACLAQTATQLPKTFVHLTGRRHTRYGAFENGSINWGYRRQRCARDKSNATMLPFLVPLAPPPYLVCGRILMHHVPDFQEVADTQAQWDSPYNAWEALHICDSTGHNYCRFRS
jgi:hypothetical protein